MLGQGSLLAWASPRKTDAQLVPDPSRRGAEAWRLGFPWPQPRVTTINMKFVEAVCVALRAQHWDVSSRLDTAQMPLGWRPQSLSVGCSAGLAEAMSLTAPLVAVEPATEDEETPCKKPDAQSKPSGPRARLSDVQFTKLATLARSLVPKGVPVDVGGSCSPSLWRKHIH